MYARLKLLSSAIVLVFTCTGEAKYGLENFKEVMPGVLYRGGGNGERDPMSSTSQRALCEAGFTTAFYLYGRGGQSQTSCGGGALTYIDHSWKKEGKVLKAVYDAIQNKSGPVYAHCWYGVHASGYVAAVALRQFCGYSASQAVEYWNSHVPRSIRYKEVQERVRNFKPDPNLSISSAQAAKYCP